MSNEDKPVDEQREHVGDEFGRAPDPLKTHEPSFNRLEAKGIDPFEMFLDDIIRNTNRSEITVTEYERYLRQFKNFLVSQGRHPACANDDLVVKFADQELHVEGNKKSSTKTKLRYVKKAYKYFQTENVFPHEDHNPVESAWSKIAWPDESEEDLQDISIEEMRDALTEITHVLKRALILMGLKLGMRQGEIRNVKLKDVHIRHATLQEHYADLGSHHRLGGRENAIFIPSRYERDGNKSRNPRVLPLDDEMRRVLMQYLLIRPDCEEPWLFLTQTHHEQISDKDGVNKHWREQLRPQFPPEAHQKELTSHFGRHWFTTYWKIKRGMEKENVQYMRGDKISDGKDNESINDYLHSYYSDIEQSYRDGIYKLLK